MIVIVMSISFVVFVSLLHIIGKVSKRPAAQFLSNVWPSLRGGASNEISVC